LLFSIDFPLVNAIIGAINHEITRNMLNKMRLTFLLFLLTAMQGCGLKGPLYIENEKNIEPNNKQVKAQSTESKG